MPSTSPSPEPWWGFVCMILFERAQLATFQCPSFTRLPIACLCVQAILINSCLQCRNLSQQMFKSQYACNLIWDIFWLLHMWDKHSNYIPLEYGFVYGCAAMFETSICTVESFIIKCIGIVFSKWRPLFLALLLLFINFGFIQRAVWDDNCSVIV